MAESKYRYRIPPCPAYDIPAMESWLEDMAAKGLHLIQDGFFGLFATFVEGVPRSERFRLEPTDTRGDLFSKEYDPDTEAVQMLLEMGWQYRARRGQFHIYSTADPGVPELNTDPRVQAMTMAALTRRQSKIRRGTLIMAIFYLLLYFGDSLVSLTVSLGTWRIGLLMGLLLWDHGQQVAELVTLRRYCRQLQNGTPLPHRSDRSRWQFPVCGAFRMTLWIALIFSLLGHLLPIMTEEVYVSPEQLDAPIPFATLEDLYPGAEVSRENGILKSQVYGWTDPLAPGNYDFTEYAAVSQDGSSIDCYLTVQYHRTRFEWVARALSRELISQAGGNFFDRTAAKFFGNDPVDVRELSVPGADYCAFYYKNLPEPYVILRSGNVVLKVRLAVLSQADEPSPEALAQMFLSQIQ